MDKITAFPKTIPISDSVSATLIGTDFGGNYFGYTHSRSLTNEITVEDRFTGVWNKFGECVYTSVYGNSSAARSARNIPPPKSDAQKQYEKLSVDQRGILAALTNTDHSLARNYLKETLKVDVNLNDIIIYAIKKDFKA